MNVDGFAKDISFDEVPKTIQKIALREIGDVPIRDVDREKEDGETVYDIEAKDDSIDIELEIAADGTLREKDVTETIAFSELPIPVQDTVHRHAGTLKINDVERRTGLGMRVVGHSLQTETVYYDVEAEEFGVEIDKARLQSARYILLPILLLVAFPNFTASETELFIQPLHVASESSCFIRG